jgi:uncharacterized membrane protein YwzB
MNYKIYLYVFFTFLCIYVFSALDFSKIIRPNKTLEAKILVFILSFAFSYLLTNFIYDFINCSSIF